MNKLEKLKNFFSDLLPIMIPVFMLIMIAIPVFMLMAYESNNNDTNKQPTNTKTIRLTVIGKTNEVSRKPVGRIIKTVTKPVVIVEYKGDLVKVFITEKQANVVDIGKSYLFVEYDNGRLSLRE